MIILSLIGASALLSLIGFFVYMVFTMNKEIEDLKEINKCYDYNFTQIQQKFYRKLNETIYFNMSDDSFERTTNSTEVN